MAIEATKIYGQNNELFDEEAQRDGDVRRTEEEPGSCARVSQAATIPAPSTI